MGYATLAPAKKEAYKKQIRLFSKGAPHIECVRAHFFPERNGNCDLTLEKELQEIFVLSNRSSETLKVSKLGLEIVANSVDIQGLDHWYQNLKEQKKQHKARLVELEAQRESERNKHGRAVLIRRKGSQKS